MGRPRTPRRASHNEAQIAYGRFELDELFQEWEVLDLCSIAHDRIAGTFLHATTKKAKPTFVVRHEDEYDFSARSSGELAEVIECVTENYICGVGGHCKELADYIARNLRHHIVTPKQLPDDLRDLNYRLQQRIALYVERKVILLELASLKKAGDIWYDEGFGFWCIRQSCIDTYELARRRRRQQFKRDDRSFHGKNRAQVVARNMPPGASTSGQYAC